MKTNEDRTKDARNAIQNLAETGWSYPAAFQHITHNKGRLLQKRIAEAEIEAEENRPDPNETYVNFLNRKITKIEEFEHGR